VNERRIVAGRLTATQMGLVRERRTTLRICSDNCAKIRELGYTVSMHIKMYGQDFEIVSDPFDEGDGVAVRATSGNDPKVRTLLLPVAILLGPSDRFSKGQL
jgi:hypothetical protein